MYFSISKLLAHLEKMCNLLFLLSREVEMFSRLFKINMAYTVVLIQTSFTLMLCIITHAVITPTMFAVHERYSSDFGAHQSLLRIIRNNSLHLGKERFFFWLSQGARRSSSQRHPLRIHIISKIVLCGVVVPIDGVHAYRTSRLLIRGFLSVNLLSAAPGP